MTRFLAVWAGQLASLLGSGLTAFALAVWIYRRTGAVTDLALIAVAAYLPHVLVAPYGGVLADRFDRRIVMLLADTGSAVATLLLLAFTAAGRLESLPAAVIVAAGACCNAVQWPAYEAAIVTLVPREQLGRANGLCELSRGTSQLLAPILAGALYDSLGLRGILIIDLASFVVGIAPLLALRFPPHPRGARSVRGWLADLGAAWDLVARRSGLVAMLVLFSRAARRAVLLLARCGGGDRVDREPDRRRCGRDGIRGDDPAALCVPERGPPRRTRLGRDGVARRAPRARLATPSHDPSPPRRRELRNHHRVLGSPARHDGSTSNSPRSAAPSVATTPSCAARRASEPGNGSPPRAGSSARSCARRLLRAEHARVANQVATGRRDDPAQPAEERYRR